MKNISFSNFFIAAIFIFSGGWLLFWSLGLVHIDFGTLFGGGIAAIIFIYGLWSIFGPLMRRRNPQWFLGLLSSAYGGLLLADDFGLLHFQWTDIWKLWPIVLIYIGIEMIGPFRVRRKADKEKLSEKKAHDQWAHKGASVFNIVRESSFTEPNWSVEPMTLRSFVGDLEFDFTKAFIPDRETDIYLSGFVGDIDVIIPEDVAFMIRGEANIVDLTIGDYEQNGVGRRELFFKTPDFDAATRRIVLDISYKILDLNVDRV
ncbi:hypothetical protein GCM10011391_24160 [Pullulanibacillus camelliae]|uniref:Cell wall-active antibiotics response LiaF-like C-terminal domain-containing protein n=1 Tax=Pullulanibacillus camelliae TaxID=1707096 RepID=A0A8J2YI95_9BACL|nr:cell wall-active antibiotics response protein LiaF [Pullulanibacillus camelliae]GGE44538.1 hypothetical protein GCM10011391_24160 [Pullulanibacillus camelliae]